jgi:hypothetical protein
MSPELKRKIEAIEAVVASIPDQPTHTRDNLPKEAAGPGIYVLSEDQVIQYVGRANKIRKRVQQHSRPSSGGNAAPFAFRLAKQALGLGKATYTKKGSRTEIEKTPDFQKAFADAKTRIRAMAVRFIREDDPVTQAIMEVCVAVELKAIHNDFDNH